MTHTKTYKSVGTRTMVLGLLVALLAASLMIAARPAHADLTFTVNSTGDSGTGGCNSTECTLREAIAVANRVEGADTIRFNIPGEGVKTISPTSELPTIIEAVTIDGYTQPGASLNTLAKGTNAQLMIELDGIGAGETAGLDIVASNVVVRGLVINRFEDGNGIIVSGASTTGVKVEGNFIGTDPSGTLDLGNRDNGVLILDGTGSTVGGNTPDKRNLISGNDASGVAIRNGARGNRVQGNLIGTKTDGTSALGNASVGVAIHASDDNSVGDGSSGDANTIAFNGSDGVAVSDADSTGNLISLNSIFSNAGLGINLVGGTENAAGATANDTGDPDSGPNDLQNKPVITSATTSGGKTTIQAGLNSTPNQTFRVLFFSNPSGNEGMKFIGQKSVSTNSNGNVTFTFVPSQAVAAGQRITATATNVVEANTSEFSAPRTVVQG